MDNDDILSDYGRDSGAPQRPRATNGGAQTEHDVMNYSPPRGPIGIMRQPGTGLGGSNAGAANRPTANDGAMGQPGLGGENCGQCGSQGKY